MNKFIDDKGLKRYTDNMKLLLKKKVSKKRPYGQIVIGKSINPKSYYWGTIYAFREHPCITIWSNNKVEKFNIIIYDTKGTDISTTYYNSSGMMLFDNKKAKYSHTIHFGGYSIVTPGVGFKMFIPYTNGDTTIHLQEVNIPGNNLTGTSKKYSWVNGKRVTSKKGTFEMACETLRYRFNYTPYDLCGGIVKACHLTNGVVGVSYWKHGVCRGKPYRDKFPNKKKKYTRFTRKTHGLGGGLWLVRFYDRRSKTYMNDVKVYVRKTKEGKLIFKRT